MAALIVIDSGILISSVFPEPLTVQAKELLEYWQQQNVQRIAPTLFRYEVVAVTGCLSKANFT